MIQSHPYTDLKEGNGCVVGSNNNGWASSAISQTACYPYASDGLYNPYGDRYVTSMDSAARRKNATRETTNTLKAWLYEHRKNPYPTKGEKIMLAIITKMTLTQVRCNRYFAASFVCFHFLVCFCFPSFPIPFLIHPGNRERLPSFPPPHHQR